MANVLICYLSFQARDREEVRQSVNSLVHEHEANRKQIANIRRRERSVFDEQLEKRLAKIKWES